MHTIRVIHIPPLKVATSGKITTMEQLEAFDTWWSSIDAKHYITPRDFMWVNDKENYAEWIFAIPEGCTDTGGYELIDFPGGLYAVATSKDQDDDANDVKAAISQWVQDSACFELATSANDPIERFTMCHVVTPKVFKEKMGYHLSDVFVPIILKE